MRSIEQQGFDIAAGLTAVEAGPDVLKSGIKDVFGSSNLGADVSRTKLAEVLGRTTESIRDLAPSAAGLGFVVLGLRTMFKGLENPGRGRAS